jgi:hypothetical protein
VSIFTGEIQNPGSSFPVGTIQYYEIKYTVVLENQANTEIQLFPSFKPVVLEVGDPNAVKVKRVTQTPGYQEQDYRNNPNPIRNKRRATPPKTSKPANQGSTSLIVTGIVVGTVLILGGGAILYYCSTTESCSGASPTTIEPGSLEVIIVPNGSE